MSTSTDDKIVEQLRSELLETQRELERARIREELAIDAATRARSQVRIIEHEHFFWGATAYSPATCACGAIRRRR